MLPHSTSVVKVGSVKARDTAPALVISTLPLAVEYVMSAKPIRKMPITHAAMALKVARKKYSDLLVIGSSY